MLQLLVISGVISAAWYVLIVRPQREQQGTHERLVGTLWVGAHVMTVGGIYGRVVAIEGSTAVVELAPGMVTRVAVDGIARIVQGSEAPLPDTVSRHDNSHQDEHDQMNPHQQPQHPQPAMHAYTSHQPDSTGSYVPPQVTEPGPYTFRAAVTPAPAPQQVHQPVQHGQRAWAIPAPPMLALQPRARHSAPAASANVHAPAHPQPHVPEQATQVQPVQEHAPVLHRRASAAPQGMGASIRLDDPQIAEAMGRARREREELADEYRRVVSPLVVAGEPAPQPAPQALQHAPAAHGQLFVHAPSPQPVAAVQYPQPPQVPAIEHVFDAAVPRPGIVPRSGQPGAFHRSAPYAPRVTEASTGA